MRPSRLIDEAGRQRIDAAVHAAEAETSGEIVVVVERVSGDHTAAPWRFSVLLAAAVLLAVGLAFPRVTALGLFVGQFFAVLIAHGLCRVDAIRRAFILEGELEVSARLAALRAFTEQGIRRTKGRTGILIYVALLEHRVVVLGDEAIDRALGPGESWEDVVSLVLDGIRGGEATEGIVKAVQRCGEMLSHPLPASEDDSNEIVHGLFLSE
jgi:putative membrane protein